MEWQRNKFKYIEEEDFDAVSKRCGNNGIGIVRAVSIWHDDLLCGYLLTCDYDGFRSFHGFKFVKDGLVYQLEFARRYIEEEKLTISAYNKKETRAILRVLGFKEIGSKDGVFVARKE